MNLTVSETFFSIQGESSHAGRPCTFVRLAGCNLDCSYCDTRYARSGGRQQDIDDIAAWVLDQPTDLVTITGGEPLLQTHTNHLVRLLLDQGKTVLVETNGSIDIRAVDARAHCIMDLKCPDSDMADHNDMANIDRLRPHDEVKFVIASRQDFDWAVDVIRSHRLNERVEVLMSAATPRLTPTALADWILQSGLAVRLQLQIHKILWPENERGR
ncbi:MAG: radical SAM protein [Deltaproteobacteria bacterium]|nr:radical SAM protein [Deltaproteobacteria bacterium]